MRRGTRRVFALGLLLTLAGFAPARVATSAPSADPVHHGAAAGAGPAAPTFTALIDDMVRAVAPQRIMGRISELSGAVPIFVGGEPETLATRYSYSPQLITAAEWMGERLGELGYDVELQWFQVGGSTIPNVVATRRGFAHPEEIYVMGAHYDSRSQLSMSSAPGANDNASGAATVMEAARVFSTAAAEATVKFVLFAGEEQGMVGSYDYVARARAAGDSVAGAIILDMVSWWQSSYAIQVEGGVPWEWLQNVMVAACAEYTDLGAIKTYYSWGSDHVPFQEAGYPAFLAIENEWDAYSCYHRTCDVASIQDVDMVADVTRASVAALASLARVTTRTDVAIGGPGGAAGTATGANGAGVTASIRLGVAPNPAARTAAIELALDAPDEVNAALYDPRGRRVATVCRARFPAGEHRVAWSIPERLPAGVYFLRASGAGSAATIRLVIAR